MIGAAGEDSENSSMRPDCKIGAVLAIVSALVGCSSPGSNLPTLPPKPDLSSYHLGPSDRLGVKVLGADELAGEYLVQDDGTIRMLIIGVVPAAGLTPDQLERNIEAKLKAGHYITDPHASVAVLSYRPFYIFGEVARPCGYPYAI